MLLTQNNNTVHTRERETVWVQTYPFMANLPFHCKLTLSWQTYPFMANLPFHGRLTLSWQTYPFMADWSKGDLSG